MSSVLSEYPETLPAPMVGVVTPTERRKVGSIGGVQSFRTVQRDRHGARTYAFTFTNNQAAIFRDWWAEWEQRGGGWFAANWPLPWSRGPNVFRFKNPPEWSLIGGGVDGQGYWRVSGSLEIRGRGMLPTVEVLYLTSTPYPVEAVDELSYLNPIIGRTRIDPISMAHVDSSMLGLANFGISVRNMRHDISNTESIQVRAISYKVSIRLPIQSYGVTESIFMQPIANSIKIRRAVIYYRIPDGESISMRQLSYSVSIVRK